MDDDQRKTFDRLFSPKSLTIIGTSKAYSGLDGQFFLRNLQRADFPGRVYLIDPITQEINGLRTYPNISALPEVVDLAIVCLPAKFVSSVLSECVHKGVRNVHILTSGFKELRTPEGIQLENEILRESLKGQLNVVGPNCMGPYVPASRLMLWGQIPANPGTFAFISQSDNLTQRMTEYAHFMGFGISKAVSFGNATVLDSTDYLEYLAEDEGTRVIGFYLDSVQNARRFLDVARRLNRTKPLVLWKAGETALEAGSVASNPTISREDRIWENGLRQMGVTRVCSLEEMACTAMALLNLPPPKGRRLFILGGGGGNSVYYADVCLHLGLQIPPLTGETQEKITALVPAVGSFARNPVDAWRSFHDPDFMKKILDVAFSDQDLDMIILDRLIHRLTFGQPVYTDTTQLTIDYLQKNRMRKPVVVVVDGSGEDPFLAEEAAKMRQFFCQARIPAYSSLPLAAQALAHIVTYYEKIKSSRGTASVDLADV
jgi:acyl-CoA synthetase (NDP forming)